MYVHIEKMQHENLPIFPLRQDAQLAGLMLRWRMPSSIVRMSAVIQLLRKSMSGEASVDDHIIALGDHQSLLVFARRWERPMRLNKPSRPG
jgi:hypothetical protein